MTLKLAGATVVFLLIGSPSADGQQAATPVPRYAPREQYGPGQHSSRNMRLEFHIPSFSASDIRRGQPLTHGGPELVQRVRHQALTDLPFDLKTGPP